MVRRISRRIEDLTGLSTKTGEDLQVIKIRATCGIKMTVLWEPSSPCFILNCAVVECCVVMCGSIKGPKNKPRCTFMQCSVSLAHERPRGGRGGGCQMDPQGFSDLKIEALMQSNRNFQYQCGSIMNESF